MAGTHRAWRLDGTFKDFVLTTASSAPADARCRITQTPTRLPNGYPFVPDHRRRGGGMYVVEKAGVTVAPIHRRPAR